MKLTPRYLLLNILGIPLHIKRGGFYRFCVRRILRKRMAVKLKQIQTKNKIRVGFLVAEASKWGYQSVYEAFANDKRFEPVILTTKLALEHKNGVTHYKTMADCRAFFESKGMNIESAYDDEKKQYIPLSQLDIDIVFYEQPWELAECQHPAIVSQYAITCYSLYGFDLMKYEDSYMEQFHRLLDFFFNVSNATYEYIKTMTTSVNNIEVVGWPKLDEYQDLEVAKTEKPVIIYAPHHSFEKNGLNLATFQYNGQYILDLAMQTSDNFDWVFKPHPRLKHALIKNNILTEQQVNDYWAKWEHLGTVCDTGGYFGLFLKSCALITDCCSFLGEYLPTKKPVLHLINTKAKFNDVAKSFIGTYYQIYDNKQLTQEFNRILINGDDYKKAERLSKIPLIFDKNEKSGVKIYKRILKLLGK